MVKLRRKAEIRQRVAAELAALVEHKEEWRDWRHIFLEAIISGASASRAASIAGVSRQRAYRERYRREFDDAWYRAENWRRAGFRHMSDPIWPPRGMVISGDAVFSVQR